MAMGFERFFARLVENPSFVHRLLEARMEWCLAMYRRAVDAGAEVLVLGDDSAHGKGPMISPRMWRRFVFPYHRRIVESLPVPVIWHSDGNIEALLPMAIEAGFVGIHGLDPMAGMDLARIKREYGRDLTLVGNVDIRVLFGDDLSAVRDEVDRCIAEGAGNGGYMIASCNSICAGMRAAAVAELFRYEAVAGVTGRARQNNGGRMLAVSRAGGLAATPTARQRDSIVSRPATGRATHKQPAPRY
jgi:uroporphyrinogen decarboxylase